MATFTGIAFPFSKGATSFPAATTDSDLIKQSMIQILLTGRGERVMYPEFGSNVQAIVFENTGPTLVARIRSEVLSSISRWEPRVILQGVDVSEADGNVFIDISYIIIATRQPDSMRLALRAA